MNQNSLKNLETLLCKAIDDFCNVEEEIKGSDYLSLLSRFLTFYSDKCIRLSKDCSYNNVLLQSEKNDPYFKIPKYQWDDQLVLELKIPILNNDISICAGPSTDILPPTSNLFKVAVYKPTRIKEFAHYQYEFVRMDER